MDFERAAKMTREELDEYRKELNRQRNKEMRDRAKANGNTINIARTEQRHADKAIITPTIQYEVKDIKKANKLPEMRTEPKQEITKKKYILFIKRFYRKYTGNELDENADVILKINEQPYKALNISKQFKEILTKNFNDIKAKAHDVSDLYSIFLGIRGFTDIAKRLKAYVDEYRQQYQEKRSIIEVKNMEDLNISFDREVILNNIEKLEDREDKIIYGSVMMLRCRLHNLRITKITKNKNDIKNEEYNWIYENKLYINITKNKKKQVIDIPKEMQDLYGDADGYLFGTMSEKTAPALSHRFQRITKKVYGKSYSYLNIRHIYATYINNKGSSYKERLDTAKRSGHTVEEQLRYAYRFE